MYIFHTDSLDSLDSFELLRYRVCQLMMMIAPNSRASKGGKKRGEVTGKYGGISGGGGEC